MAAHQSISRLIVDNLFICMEFSYQYSNNIFVRYLVCSRPVSYQYQLLCNQIIRPRHLVVYPLFSTREPKKGFWHTVLCNCHAMPFIPRVILTA